MHHYERAHSHRIIGSVIYDGLIMLGLLMIAGALALPINNLLTGDPSNGSHPIFQLYLLIVFFGYYLYFWSRSGQTVGMKAWRIKLIPINGDRLTWHQMALRMLAAVPAYSLLCLGAVWQYWDRDQLNWQDRASGTKLVYLGKK